MLEKCFDKKMQDVVDIETAKKYLENIQNFERLMATSREENFYQKYYHKKLEEIEEILLRNGENETDVRRLIFINNDRDGRNKKRQGDPYPATISFQNDLDEKPVAFANIVNWSDHMSEGEHYEELDLDKFKNFVTRDDLIENDKLVNAKDKKSVINKIKAILHKNKEKTHLEKNEGDGR